MLGATCTNRMRQVDAPVTRAASTKARSRTVSTCERMTRAVFGQSSSAMPRIDVAGARPEEAGQHDDEGQERDAERDVGEPHQHGVDPAAEIAGDEPDHRADQRDHDGRGQADIQRARGCRARAARRCRGRDWWCRARWSAPGGALASRLPSSRNRISSGSWVAIRSAKIATSTKTDVDEDAGGRVGIAHRREQRVQRRQRAPAPRRS